MKIFISIMILCSVFFITHASANSDIFNSVKNARELAKRANQYHFHINFRYRQAKTISQFDKVENINVRGNMIYAVWYNSFRMNDYIGKGIDDAQKELRNSNISVKYLYTPTTSDLYNRIYKQSIAPGKMVYAKASPSRVSTTTDNSFGHYETIKVRSGFGYKTKKIWVQGRSKKSSRYTTGNTPYDAQGNVILTLYAYKYAGVLKKMVNLKGLTLQEAKLEIKKHKLPIGYIQDIYKDTSNPKLYGKIFDQSIKAGTLIRKPQYIGVKIYSAHMPDLTKGWTVQRASKIAYISLVHLYTKTYDKKKDGMIFYQSIKAGTVLKKKTLLTVKAYKYENPSYRADYIHLNKNAAIQKAKQRGLKYKVVEKDIFKYFRSTTLGSDFYKKHDNTVVDVKEDGKTIVFTIAKYTQKDALMPNLINKACSNIVKPMYKLKQQIPGLTYKIEYIPELVFEKSDTVAKTKPEAGKKIKTLDNVIIFCRRFSGKHGDTEAKIPNLRKKSQEEALKTLNNLGFRKIKTVKLSEKGYVEGTVVEITGNTPYSVIGKKIYKNETIHLYVADSKAQEMFLMPNVVGLSMEKAKQLLLAKGFGKIKFTDEASSWAKYKTNLPKGSIIKSYPSYKALVKHSDEVELIVRLKQGEKLLKDIKNKTDKSSGMTTVPPLKKRLVDTVEIIKQRGLFPLRSGITLSTNPLLEGTVVLDSSSPPSNTIVKRGSKVRFSVYSTKTSMPYVIGLSKKDAISKIKKHLLGANITYEITTDKDKIDTVFTQNPPPNSSVKCGSAITLTIYKKADKFIKMPDIKMKKYGQDIVDLLSKKYGLKVKVLGSASTKEKDKDGKISSTQPEANAEVAVGSTVNIFLYKFSTVKFPRFRFSKQISKPSVQKRRTAELSPESDRKIREFYRNFKEAYESKDESRVTSFLSSSWTSASGGDVSDMEDNLNRTFRVFDEIEYKISSLNIQPMGNNRYRVSYTLNIVGQIYDDDITHEEKSSVQEEVSVRNGKVEIEKTLGGRYWSIK